VASRHREPEDRCVYLVGAGPGDPELLTVKAVRLLREADVVVFDRLVAAEILDLVPRGVPRIYAGKALGQHSLQQVEINDLLVRLARSHRRIVRLKGGDPYIFGRGSEEALHLAAHRVSFEVVPGITAAAGCAARVGIPLTHRGLASGVRLVAGHCRADVPLDLNWESLADRDTTLVFYMGLANLPQIGRRLIDAGLPPDTPAAAISNGTTPQEAVCFAPLGQLAARVQDAGLKAPVIIVVGRVVQFAPALAEAAATQPIRVQRYA
jgi:uroporphyrin-III C-methyltransferase/precorrin-2 dehydrogenase/sirohydrochlorin ferrochelatase/uroporphyrin-III C-methyltransferase